MSKVSSRTILNIRLITVTQWGWQRAVHRRTANDERDRSLNQPEMPVYAIAHHLKSTGVRLP